MNLLAIDTSTDRASLALTVDGQVFVQEQAGVKTHALILLPLIDALLKQAAIGIGDLDGIVFGRGPGSFTGLRVACSAAKGLAFAIDRPVYAVSSLAAIAWSVRAAGESLPVLSVIDARMSELYWCLFEDDFSPDLERVSPASAIAVTCEHFCLAGVGAGDYADQFSDSLKQQISSHQVVYPAASAMIGLVQAGWVKPIGVAEAKPVYIRNQVTQGAVRG